MLDKISINDFLSTYESNKNSYLKISGKISENKIILEISDSGKGIENIDIAKEPLYTTKPNLERSGMGFSFMEAFMDTLSVESEQGKGTRVTMTKRLGADVPPSSSDE